MAAICLGLNALTVNKSPFEDEAMYGYIIP